MSTESAPWTQVGRLADVLQVMTGVAGVVAVALSAAGVDVLSNPGDQTLVIGIAVFGASGLIAIVSAVVRVQRDNSGFADDGRSTNRMLYTAGVILLILASVTCTVFLTRDVVPATESCVAQMTNLLTPAQAKDY